MALDTGRMNRELEEILEAISYEITAARTAGMERPERLRAALKRARDLVADADSLAAHAAARRDQE